MKMIIAAIEKPFGDAVAEALQAEQFRVTRLAAGGGFLREEGATLLVAVEEPALEAALKIIRQHTPPAAEAGRPNAVIYVLEAKAFKRAGG